MLERPITLSDLYDPDMRAVEPKVMSLASKMPAPHPLAGVDYADGRIECTHAKKHDRWDYCPQAGGPDG